MRFTHMFPANPAMLPHFFNAKNPALYPATSSPNVSNVQDDNLEENSTQQPPSSPQEAPCPVSHRPAPKAVSDSPPPPKMGPHPD